MGHMTRTRLSPTERRAQLLDLGMVLLAERGLEDLSIDVLAEHAGISRGLLYHYFTLAFSRLFACLERRRIFHDHIFMGFDWVCNYSGGLAALFRLLLALWRSSFGGKLSVDFYRRWGR